MIDGCRRLLRGEAVDGELVLALGGPPARWAVEGGEPGPAYWTRVWAARGLQWAWDEAAAPEVGSALSDEAWRVREMAVKLVRRHLIQQVRSQVVELTRDDAARVRAEALRTLHVLDEARAR